MVTLLVDNYDSYTFNLYQLIAAVQGVEPLVVQNDDFGASWDCLCKALPPGEAFDCVVISPGPGSPSTPSDVGLSQGALEDGRLPVLGVCLGHQLIAHLSGATVNRALEPMHGRTSQVHHNGAAMFEGIPSPFEVVRYHSLAIDESFAVPEALRIVARTACGVAMGLELALEGRLAWGVQFHPESICSQFGERLVANFTRAATAFVRAAHPGWRPPAALNPSLMGPKNALLHHGKKVVESAADSESRVSEEGKELEQRGSSAHSIGLREGLELVVQEVRAFADLVHDELCTELVFDALFPSSEALAAGSTSRSRFWLDSATRGRSSGTDASEAASRFSYMGDASGPLAQLVEAFVDPRDRTVKAAGAEASGALLRQVLRVSSRDPTSTAWKTETQVEGHDADVFAHLEQSVRSLRACTTFSCTPTSDLRPKSKQREVRPIAEWDLPFPFSAGYVGYFGYGLRRLCGVKSTGVQSPAPERTADSGPKADDAPAEHSGRPQACGADKFVPDATFLLVDRFVAWDHDSQLCYVVTLRPRARGREWEDQARWASIAEQRLAALAQHLEGAKASTPSLSPVATESGAAPATGAGVMPLPLVANADDAQYAAQIARCIELIRDGETYEVCLTRQLCRPTPSAQSLRPRSRSVYKKLRSSNPAPYAAFFEVERIGEDLSRTSDFAVCCSSPERFLRVDQRGIVESKPIKGTIRRGSTLAEDQALAESLRCSAKDRSENLMIVDLVRNDIGRVCEIGSVHVPKLMEIESFASVHQLVSTVRGTLGPGCGTLDVVRAAFPGGSMTGAPKLRTMRIIDELEKDERGVYSGSLGFLSLNGSSDLNIVIRTAVVTPEGVSVGTGGAIVVLSDVQAEVEETVLKAAKLQSVLAPFFALR